MIGPSGSILLGLGQALSSWRAGCELTKTSLFVKCQWLTFAMIIRRDPESPRLRSLIQSHYEEAGKLDDDNFAEARIYVRRPDTSRPKYHLGNMKSYPFSFKMHRRPRYTMKMVSRH